VIFDYKGLVAIAERNGVFIKRFRVSQTHVNVSRLCDGCGGLFAPARGSPAL